MKKPKRGINASALQVKLAYKLQYNVPLPDDMSYVAALQKLIDDLGWEAAEKLVLSQSNDTDKPQ